MAISNVDLNVRPAPDAELVTMADYVLNTSITSDLAYSTARFCLMDALGCAALALNYPACTSILGPIIPGTIVPIGARVPGTDFYLDPILAAFNIGTLIRWLDFNDTWLAAEFAHPSDNLGAILAVSDYLSRLQKAHGNPGITIKNVLTAMIKAYEIQGVLALENGFNRLGLDHVAFVRVASTAVATQLLGGTREMIINALSQAWLDGAALRTYRHAPNAGSRKSWAAGDATSRGVRLAWLSLQGEMGYPSALSAKKWGFYDVVTAGKPLRFQRPYASYVMENILFKIAYPAEFHAQTAVEAAIKLHPFIKNKIDDIDKIVIDTHESAIRIISKSGELHNPADRDHCLQYMVAVGLLEGDLRAEHYENTYATNLTIDRLREKMVINENTQFSQDYLDPSKRSIANSLQLFFKDGTQSEKITIEYPLGHVRRREEGIPLLVKKFTDNMSTRYPAKLVAKLASLFADRDALEKTTIDTLLDQLTVA